MRFGYAITAGAYLPNGAMLLAQREFEKRDNDDHNTTTRRYICLAVNPGGEYVEPFVTWDRVVTHKKGDACVVVAQDTCWGNYFAELGPAWDNYLKRVEEKTHDEANAKAIRERGHADGKTAAGWLVDGNTNRPFDVLKRLVQGMDDGDPEIMDELPSPRLGGEFADDPSWEDIVRDETTIEELSDDGENDLMVIYEEAFNQGVEEQIRGMLNAWDPATNYGQH
jgi:hypothetical protein